MQLKDQISRNEKILWEGIKDKRVTFFESIFNQMAPFAIIWFLFDAFMLSTISSVDDETGYFRLGMVGFFMLHMLPVWIYLGGIIFSIWKAKNTKYLITDKGIYVQAGILTTITEMKPFTDLSHVSVRQGLIDRIFHCGDVITVCNHHSTSAEYGSVNTATSHSHSMNIENIADFEEVFKLIKEYQEAIYSDTMYPNDLRPSENHGYNTKYEP